MISFADLLARSLLRSRSDAIVAVTGVVSGANASRAAASCADCPNARAPVPSETCFLNASFRNLHEPIPCHIRLNRDPPNLCIDWRECHRAGFVSSGKCLYEKSSVAFRMGSNRPVDLTWCITKNRPACLKPRTTAQNPQSRISRRTFWVGSHLCAPFTNQFGIRCVIRAGRWKCPAKVMETSRI